MMKLNLISHALIAIAIVLCSESTHALSKNSVSASPFLKTKSRSLRRKETDDMEQRNADNDPPGFESDDASTDGTDDTNDTGGNGGTVNDDVTDDNGESNDTGGNGGTVNDDVIDDNGETDDSTDDPCQLENGSFGDATGTSTEISYSYEIITMGDLTPDILNGLELSISESISSDLWDCSRRRVLRNGLRKRKLEITGLSAQPTDVVNSEIQCATAVEGDEQCSVVDGRLTIYGTEDEDGQILNVIEEGMSENGTLADSSEVIKRLVYIPPSDETIVVVTEDENFNNSNFKKASGGGDSNVIAIASGACALVIIGFVAGRRLYKKNSADSSSDSSSSDGEEISEGFQDISEAEDINNSNVIAAGVLNSSGSVTVSSSFAT